MTSEEAISYISCALSGGCYQVCSDQHHTECDKYVIIAAELAIEALEKQIPKPKHKCMGYRCVCGELVGKNQDYCEYCGQALLPYEE